MPLQKIRSLSALNCVGPLWPTSGPLFETIGPRTSHPAYPLDLDIAKRAKAIGRFPIKNEIHSKEFPRFSPKLFQPLETRNDWPEFCVAKPLGWGLSQRMGSVRSGG